MTDNQTRGSNIPSIERATSRAWGEWVKLLDDAGGRDAQRDRLITLTRGGVPPELKNPEWWIQGIVIAYEQHIGRRVPGQSSTGDYRVSASRTLKQDRDAAIETWVALHGEHPDHLGFVVSKRRTARTEKRSFYRFDLEGGGRVEVSATPKDSDRVILGVEHTKLTDPDQIELWRAHWKALLAEL